MFRLEFHNGIWIRIVGVDKDPMLMTITVPSQVEVLSEVGIEEKEEENTTFTKIYTRIESCK